MVHEVLSNNVQRKFLCRKHNLYGFMYNNIGIIGFIDLYMINFQESMIKLLILLNNRYTLYL